MIKLVIPTRFSFPDECTIGKVIVYDLDESTGKRTEVFKCLSLENPWMDNKVNISCIPTGSYIIARDNFRNKYQNYKLLYVKGRSAIEFHKGDRASHTKGCLLLGRYYREDSKRGIFELDDSAGAFDGFMVAMDGVPTAALVIQNKKVACLHD